MWLLECAGCGSCFLAELHIFAFVYVPTNDDDTQ